MESYKTDFIQFLLDKKVLLIGEFPLKSGRISPYFLKLDAVNDGEGLIKLAEAYASTILANIKPEDFDGIAGIPQKAHTFGPAVAIGLALKGCNKRYSSWRDKPKTYGD